MIGEISDLCLNLVDGHDTNASRHRQYLPVLVFSYLTTSSRYRPTSAP